jgi:hypothetical protein
MRFWKNVRISAQMVWQFRLKEKPQKSEITNYYYYPIFNGFPYGLSRAARCGYVVGVFTAWMMSKLKNNHSYVKK